MRVINEIFKPGYRVTIFHWNNKYIIKLETPMLEQTYKVDQFEVASESDLENIFDTEFEAKLMARFESMRMDFHAALSRLDDSN